MFIDKYPNNGVPYLRVVETLYVTKNGKLKQSKKVLRNIGPLSRFDDGKPDYLQRLRASFKAGKPLIDSLSDLVNMTSKTDIVSVKFNRKDTTSSFLDLKNIGYFVLDALYDALGIYDVLNQCKSDSRLEYDLNGQTKMLIFGRLLSPDSKCATWQMRDKYLFDVVASKNKIEVYRALDVLDKYSAKIQQRMNTKIDKHIGRSKAICFYDVTNYWFEINDPDEDILSSSGEVLLEGFRKRGPSKAKNRKPIVQMGLFMDDCGIPVSYKLFPGNHVDQTTLRPAMKETLSKMGYERAIIVADGGLNSGKNLAHIQAQGNGYIVSKSAKGSAKEVKQWLLDEAGYIWNEKKTFKLKSKERTRLVEDEDGNEVCLKEKIISYWSKKQYDYAMHENRKFIDYLHSVIEHPDKLKDKPSKLKKYLIETKADKKTGEIVNTATLLSLDMEKIECDLGLMGYYTLMTSETEMDAHEVIDKYHGLSRIEDAFRVIKSDLEGRPVFVNTPEHINAHFLICFIALTMIRLLQYKILRHEGKAKNQTGKWEMGLSAQKIKKALADYMADLQPGDFYKLTKPSDALTRIFEAIGVDFPEPLPYESELRQLKYRLDKTIFM